MQILLSKYLICCVLVFQLKLVFAQNFLFTKPVNLKMAPGVAEIFKPEKLVFSNPIYGIDFPSNGSNILVKLRSMEEGEFKNKGSISYFNPKEKREIWGKQISYDNGEVFLMDTLIFDNKLFGFHRLSLLDGKKLWYREGNVLFYFPSDSSVISTVQKSDDYQNLKIRSYHAQSGKDKWEKKLKATGGFYQSYQLDSLYIATIGSGIHLTKIKTGETWNNNLKISDGYPLNKSLVIAATVGFGMVGRLMTLALTPDYIYDIQSNLVTTDSFLLMAGQDSIVKLKKRNGEVVWKHSLYEPEMGASRIYLGNGRIFLFNTAMAKKNGQSIDFGRPFLAGYDMNTGLEIYKSYLPRSNHGIIDFHLGSDSTFYLLHYNEVRRFNLSDGKEMGKIDIDSGEINYAESFEKRDLYQDSASIQFRKIQPYGENHIAIRTKAGNVFIYNNNLDTKTFLERKSVYFLSKEIWLEEQPKFRLFSIGRWSYLTDFSNRRLVEFESAQQFKIWNSQLFVAAKNFIYTFDISSFLTSGR